MPDEGGILAPRQLTALTNTVADVAASSFHVMVIGTGGELWTFGYNNAGQLGTGGQEITLSPHLVTSFPSDERVAQAAAGGSHSLVLMESGSVYSWGLGWFGPLGHGDTEHQLLPRRIETLAGERVVRVDANRWGGGISAVITSEGAVLMFGQGANRALGLEDEEIHALPTRVMALAAGMAAADMTIGGNANEHESWSVVIMRGGGIVGESRYRWGYPYALNGDEETHISGGGCHPRARRWRFGRFDSELGSESPPLSGRNEVRSFVLRESDSASALRKVKLACASN